MSLILIVDDSATERTRMSELLKKSGHKTVLAENGQEALDAVAANRPDVIMMDVNMPVMDGFAATRALRANADTKDIPVILVTSKDQKADKAWGKMLGAKGYVTKPYTDAEVLDLLKGI